MKQGVAIRKYQELVKALEERRSLKVVDPEKGVLI